MSKKYVTGIIIAAGVILTVVGILDGGVHDVISKAVHICYECIGIG
ncbi:MAG: hypothetical protein K6G72_06230 [Lachnospiraceae bacterium]|nr:hypothetical protein [Lachnospiraceae bacterium]